MATRTISNTGGNWNATGTWVEGVVPTSADDIVATATSGNLTINVGTAAARSVNFTNYVGTLIMSNNIAISGTVLNTFVNTMTITGTARLRFTAASSLTTNGLLLPVVELAGVTLNDTLNVGNLFSVNTNISGNVICNGNIEGPSNGTNNNGFKTKMIGTQSHTIAFSGYRNGILEIDGSGTFSFQGSGVSAPVNLAPANSGTTLFRYINGNLANPDIRISRGIGGGPVELDTASYSIGWNTIYVKMPEGDVNLTLTNNLKCKNLIISTEGGVTTTKRSLNFIGPGVVEASEQTYIIPYLRPLTTDNNKIYPVGTNIRLTAGLTYSFGSLFSYGVVANFGGEGTDGNHFFYSSSAGTKAGINVTGTQSITYTDFTDISASQSVYTVLGQTSNVTNVTSLDRYYYSAGGGVSGGSFTFVN